jgi:hypothetical protein
MSKKDFYCGTRELPDNYERHGSKYECLRRGFGIGAYTERDKLLKHLQGGGKKRRKSRDEGKSRGEEKKGGTTEEKKEDPDIDLQKEFRDIIKELAALLHTK